jgi:hypothetical protein
MIRFLVLSLLVFSPAVARGQIINGDFSQGAHGWNTIYA